LLFPYKKNTYARVLPAQFKSARGEVFRGGLVHHASDIHGAREKNVVPFFLEEFGDEGSTARGFDTDALVVDVPVGK
jgi:hypothetical protein